MANVARTSTLPIGIEDLASCARREGFQHLDRLVQDFQSLENTFSEPNEALFLAQDEEGNLVGIGGLNIDPCDPSGAIGRVRRLYVHPEQRAKGIGTALVKAIEAHARGRFDVLRLFTRDPAAAEFYLALGYRPVAGGREHSHVKRLGA